MPNTSLIGTTLAGRFRITGVIGEGGMATVYRGLLSDPEDASKKPTEVAIKIMNPDLAKESRFVRRFRREAKAAAMLKHPNTVQIVEFGVDQGFVFMVMEQLQGFDLAMLLHRERRIPEARAVQIVVQVCRALSAAHEQSIVHRDLKPDNIMLVRQPPGSSLPVAGMNPNDFVKVLDFGIAKILDDEPGAPVDSRVEPITQEKSMLTRVGTIVGTPAYMAPEQGRAEPVDARTDLYACGVLTYELITGRVPFTGETPMQVVMRHVNEPPKPPSDYVHVHPDLERVIMRALAKWPSERQQSAEEMAFDLLSALPKLGAQAPLSIAKKEELANKTLVLDPTAPAPSPGPPGQAPRPPPPRPAAGSPPRAAARADHQGGAGAASVTETQGANPFPTLNIEVPDDIFPPLPSEVASLPSTDPLPTEHKDVPTTKPAIGPPQRPAGASTEAVVGRARVAAPQPSVPVVRPGVPPAGSPLATTMQSTPDTSPPPSSDDDEEAATMIKAVTEVDKARMSLAEEQMAKALGRGAPAAAAPHAPAELKGAPAESVEPTLIAGAPVGRTDEEDPIDLRNLQSTVRVDPAETEKAVLDAIAARDKKGVTPAPPAPASPIPLASQPPRGRELDGEPLDLSGVGEQASLGAPARKPTSELLPLTLPEERPSAAPKVDKAAVWQPKKGRRLSGAVALIIGILIGALLVATALIVAILVRRPPS